MSKRTTYEPKDYDPVLEVDENQGYKASKLNITSFAMPHMRSFHFAWLSFFVAFLGWFALAPLMPVLKADLGLTDADIYAANISSVAATVVARFIVGPLCDRFGPKNIQCVLLLWGALCVSLATSITNATGLIIIRLFIGVVGSAFVPCQYWATMLFTKEKAGTAQAISGGWGNLGGGAPQFLLTAIYEGFLVNHASSTAWRLTMIVPAALLVTVSVAMYFLSTDSPQGDFGNLIHAGTKKKVSATTSARAGFSDPVAWVLCVQYAASFGVELTVNNTMTMYFKSNFDVSLLTASTIASCFGLMNLFARAMGGMLSDKANQIIGMRGRLLVHMGVLLFEGIMLIIFSQMKELTAAIIVLIIFSIFTQCAEGATFALVPYVNPSATGSIAGIVGAGGNIGAVTWGTIFLVRSNQGLDAAGSFQIVGICVIIISLLSVFIFFKDDYDGIFCNPRRTNKFNSIRKGNASLEIPQAVDTSEVHSDQDDGSMEQ